MAETKVDVVRPSPLTLSPEEVDDILGAIDAGKLPPDYLDRCDEAREANVFGVDHKKDRHGNPQEQGLGSPGNQTANSLAAYKKFHNPNGPEPDPDFDAHIKRLEAELAATNEARKAAEEAKGRRRRARK